MTAAWSLVPFQVLVPEGLGTPVKILVSDPTLTSPKATVLALLYDTNDYGRVVVKEHLPDVPTAQYDAVNEQWASQSGQPNFYGIAKIVSVRDGQEALSTISPDDVASLFWLEGGIEISVRGPSLNEAQCESIANAL